MPLINHPIPTLFNGVSQQSPSVRQPSQCDLQENANSSIVEGVHKRHPTVHVAKLSSSSFTGAYVHAINRDAAEKYQVVITNGAIGVWDINGTQKTVNAPNGYGYLASTAPQTDFDVVTVADYTFIVNKTITTAMLTTTTAANPTNVAYFYVCAAPAQHTITAVVNGVSASASLSTSGGTQGGFASSLGSALATALGGGYTISYPQPEVIKVTKASGSITSASCSDTYGNGAIRCLNNNVAKYSDLPYKFETGFVIQISGTPGEAKDAYYVQWDNTAGNYVETVKPGSKYKLDPATMPYKLVRESNGTFTFQQITWSDMTVGDPVVSGYPSFVGRKLNAVFFWRNRLALLADENVIFSRAGSFFNFFPETIVQVLDSDPIDIAVSHTKVSILRHAIPFNKNLVLFSDLTQFVLSTQDLLTPKTAAIFPTTEFECSKSVKPVTVGNNIYFAVDKSGYTGLREYYVANMQLTFDADDVTAHVPRYIPGGVYRLASASNDDVLFALSSNDPSAVYVYKYYWKGDEKAQSAWYRWSLESGTTVLSIAMMGTKLYLVVQRSDGLYMEYIDVQVGLTESDLQFCVNLDRKVSLTGVYNSGTNKTTWTLPYQAANVQVIMGSAFTGKAGGQIGNTSMPTNTTVTVTGDFSAGPCYLGIPYTMRYRFSKQFPRDSNGIAIAEAQLKLRQLIMFYTNTGYFRAEVTPKARDTYQYVCMPKALGTTGLTLGVTSVGSGTFTFPVMTDSDNAQIDLVNDSYLPCFFQSAEWLGFFSTRSQRM